MLISYYNLVVGKSLCSQYNSLKTSDTNHLNSYINKTYIYIILHQILIVIFGLLCELNIMQ